MSENGLGSNTRGGGRNPGSEAVGPGAIRGAGRKSGSEKTGAFGFGIGTG